MSTNVSKEKREQLVAKIKAIKSYIASAPQDENTARLLAYIADIEKDIKGKKYGLVFEEHREAIDEILEQNTPVLTEEKDLFIDNGGQMNFLIEGDNLAALQLLEKTHKGKIDLIYIDPPYNTGNKDFIYDDNFVDANDTFRHSKWLSFMQKRLETAQKLLSDTGLILLSIDDREYGQLKILCDSIFGEQNFAASLIWKSKSGGANDTAAFGIDHEYIICIAKNMVKLTLNKDRAASVTTSYNRVDVDGRRYALDRLDKQNLGYQPTLDFPIVGPDGKEYVIIHKDPNNKKARWRWSKDTVKERYDELVFIFPYVYTKNYEKTDGQKPRSILSDERFGRTRTGSTDLKKIIGNQSIFTYPKPVALIKYLADIATRYNSTVLDFFAGSGTTGHAVMKLNAEDGGKRRFILCTNNENNICRDVTYERIKRVIERDKYEASLKYYKVDFVPISDKLYYEYADELLKHIRELVELENGINFNGNAEIAIVLTEKELDEFAANMPEKCKAIYLGHDVLPSEAQESLFKARGIAVNIIPDYYYRELEG